MKAIDVQIGQRFRLADSPLVHRRCEPPSRSTCAIMAVDTDWKVVWIHFETPVELVGTIAWSEVESEEDDLCGKIDGLWVDVMRSDRDGRWHVMFDHRRRTAFDTREEGRQWAEQYVRENPERFNA